MVYIGVRDRINFIVSTDTRLQPVTIQLTRWSCITITGNFLPISVSAGGKYGELIGDEHNSGLQPILHRIHVSYSQVLLHLQAGIGHLVKRVSLTGFITCVPDRSNPDQAGFSRTSLLPAKKSRGKVDWKRKGTPLGTRRFLVLQIPLDDNECG